MTARTDWPASAGRRVSPLSAWSARFAAASATPTRFTIRELAFPTQLNLRGDATNIQFSSAVRRALGTHLPSQPNTWNGNQDSQLLWLGPDEWLIVSASSQIETLLSRLDESLQGMHHALTDVSANRTVIEIAGSDTRYVLAKGCSLDLHTRAFANGQSAQTLLARTQVILQSVDGNTVFHLYVRNSFAQYLATWLIDSHAECMSSTDLDYPPIASRLN